MGYSTCLNCNTVVGGYEKYCPVCEKTHFQEHTYWKTNTYPHNEDYRKEILLADINKAKELGSDYKPVLEFMEYLMDKSKFTGPKLRKTSRRK